MLEYIAKAWKIEVKRGDECIGLITEDLDSVWGLHLQTCKVSGNELRQIADKLDELNGVKNDNI